MVGCLAMSQQIAPDLVQHLVASAFPESLKTTPVTLPFRSKPLPQLAERELAARVQKFLAPPSQGRRKIWEFDANLHCSIIGTCLTNAELRQALVKLGLKEAETATEHDLHKSGVLFAGKRHDGAKMLQKALDRKHRLAVNQFGRARTPDEVRSSWQDAAQRGEIPGAYWAALTHPATNDALVREISAEVHMLSHLVGAANRADIRRLRQLEAENAELHDKIGRQQRQLADVVVARNATIRELSQALEARIGQTGCAVSVDTENHAAWTTLAADLKYRLARSESRRERLEQQLADARSALAAERDAHAAAEGRARELHREIEAIEASLAAADEIESGSDRDTAGLLNATLLYVGGRPAQIAHLRAPGRSLRCGVSPSRWRDRGTGRFVAGSGQPRRRGPVSG